MPRSKATAASPGTWWTGRSPSKGVDERGLTGLDRRYLKTIVEFYGGGPVGIEAIAATLQEETDTLVDVVEPFLLKSGLIIRTSAGRRTTESAREHLSLPAQKALF
jgi:Holliday junction DNA helicase RuvB